MRKVFVALGAALGMIFVMTGAVGAHIVREDVSANMFRIFTVGLHFEIYHALALILIGLSAAHLGSSRWLSLAGWLMFAGIVMFSGSIYLIVLTGHHEFAIITPFGGSALIVSWLLFLIAVIRSSK